MTSSFWASDSYLVTSESVTEGHPDKLCDQISDAILDAMLAGDPYAHVACEVATAMGVVLVLGEVTCDTYVEIPEIVRGVIRDVGYTKPEYGFDYRTCGIMVSLKQQSPDIAAGVNKALEIRDGDTEEAELDGTGAGDQGMMVGYACNETPELMPLPISLSHKLCRQLAKVRKDGTIPYLRPDGKSQVTIEYKQGLPQKVVNIVVGAQHDDGVDNSTIERDIRREVVDAVIPSSLMSPNTELFVNSSGRFVIGGPVSDTGFTGRKIIVDSYGTVCPHGGGAFSGKDPTKVDRAAAYMARYAAKNIVAAGLADRAQLQVAYTIGKSHPLSLSIETFETGKVKDAVIKSLLWKHFDFRPEAIIRHLGLRHTKYKPIAAYGHFGRTDVDMPWEKTDKAEILKAEAGL